MSSSFRIRTADDVTQALLRGMNINKIRNGKTILYMACKKGDAEIVDALLNNGADPLRHGQNHIGPIQIAAKNGYVNIVDRLLRAGVDIDNDNETGGTPLYCASRKGQMGVVSFLLSKGANINYVSYHGTALMGACETGNGNVVKYLLKMGANPIISRRRVKGPIRPFSNNGPIQIAAKKGYVDIIDILLKHRVDINNDAKGTPLYCASIGGHIDALEFLLFKGADINYISDYGTALTGACRHGKTDVVEFLLERGADPYIHKTIDPGPIQTAAKNGYVNIVDRLLTAGVDIDNDTKGTPLYYASVIGNIDVLDFLLFRGVDINFLSSKGTALMGACRNEKIDAVDRLLTAGADVNITNIYGVGALSYACKYGTLEIVDRLIVNGAIIDVYNSDLPPFIAAVEGNRVEIVDRLIGLGADIDIQNMYRKTGLIHTIMGTPNFKMMKLLMDNGVNTKSVERKARLFSHNLINEWLKIYGETNPEEIVDIMNKLLYLGVDINYPDKFGETVLMYYTRHGSLIKVRRLLELGADVNFRNNDGKTALSLALETQRIPMIDLLKRYGTQE